MLTTASFYTRTDFGPVADRCKTDVCGTDVCCSGRSGREAGVIARLVQGDQGQRAVPADAATPDELEAQRLELRDRLMSDQTTPNVRPWLWRTASLGQPLTELGWRTGYELRLSYYRSAS